MLTMPQGTQSFFNICGIDPGTHKFGVGILSVDCSTLKIISSTAFTLTALKLLPKDAWATEIHGERAARIWAIEDELDYCFDFYRPLRIASESPFYNPRRPMAYGSLVETLSMIRRCVWRYDMWVQMGLIDPPTVKNAVGARGDGSKDAIKKRILAMEAELCWNGPCRLDELDEHANDGLAVAKADLEILKSQLCLN